MTIEKGQPWGHEIALDGPPVTAADDAVLATMAAEALAADQPLLATVTSGDLLATLGLSEGRSGEALGYPLDLGLAHLGHDDGTPTVYPFVAHLTVRRRPKLSAALGHGPGIMVSVMNGAWVGPLRLGPRAHPNDGLLDVTEGQVPMAQRREAAKRARSGSHLPHPDLSYRRLQRWEHRFSRPVSVWLDGVLRGRFNHVGVELVPDAFTLVA